MQGVLSSHPLDDGPDHLGSNDMQCSNEMRCHWKGNASTIFEAIINFWCIRFLLENSKFPETCEVNCNLSAIAMYNEHKPARFVHQVHFTPPLYLSHRHSLWFLPKNRPSDRRQGYQPKHSIHTLCYDGFSMSGKCADALATKLNTFPSGLANIWMDH